MNGIKYKARNHSSHSLQRIPIDTIDSSNLSDPKTSSPRETAKGRTLKYVWVYCFNTRGKIEEESQYAVET